MIQILTLKRKKTGGAPTHKHAPRSLQETHGLPVLSVKLAYVCCVINFIVPGVGTMISSFACSQRHNPQCIGKHFFVGLVQLATAILIFGWVWSMIWGCSLVSISKKFADVPVKDTSYQENEPRSCLEGDPEANSLEQAA
mmetsp:Transcript_20813/g.23536  ORF Transcript_20813/g.23536 Transcript_20813/m.23536 type:complete len:140 (-) Transcript_20813:578-997(-)